MKVSVTKIFTFDAAHRLEDYVGKCAYLHGHTYRLEVTVRGEPDHRGIVADFSLLKQIVQDHYMPLLDHRFLNETLAPINTTAENMVIWFFDRWAEQVQPRYPDLELERIVLWETPTAYAALDRRDWEEARRHAHS